MPSFFSITVPSATVHLDKNRKAEVTITVSNTSGHRVRGRAMISSEDVSSNASYTVGAEIERDFERDGTHQYKVSISVPAYTPAGTYSFRMNMVEVEKPDENFSQGQAVAFEVVEPEEPKRKIPWKIPAIVIAILVVLGLASIPVVGALQPDTVEVPDVRDLTVAEATERLTDAGLEVDSEIQEVASEAAEGTVTGTEPPVGTEVDKGETVILLVSTGPAPVEVPDVTGSSVISATLKLTNAGLIVSDNTSHEFDPDVATGMVSGTEPPAGTEVELGAEIALIISDGPLPTPTVPPRPTRTVLPPVTPTPSIQDFIGTWRNVDSGTGSWTRIEITSSGRTVSAHFWGACVPADCDAGTASATFTGNPISLSIDRGFVVRQFTLLLGDDALNVKTVSDYTDARPTQTSEDVFRK